MQEYMFGKSASYGLEWDFAVSDVDRSRQWVLSAMQQHGRDLVTMLWRILGDEQDVCDAYQNAFLQLAHYKGRKKPDNVKSYVYRTASNVAISMLRRKMVERRGLSVVAADRESNRDRAQDSPLAQLDSARLQRQLRECIARLPDHLRDVVTLRDLAEQSYAQVGKMLGITPATARVYRYKAVQLLAAWMKKERD